MLIHFQEIVIADEDTEESEDESPQVLDLSSDEDDDDEEPLSQEEGEDIPDKPAKTDDVTDNDLKMDQSNDLIEEVDSTVSYVDLEESNSKTDTAVEQEEKQSDKVAEKSEIAIPDSVKLDAISKYGPSVDSHFLLIEQIRRNKFGVNFEMSEEFRALFDSQSEMMGRGLERLSKDLYR